MAAWIADRRIYLDAQGNAVEANDPAKATLLVPVGGTLPLERARALGLVPTPAAPPEPAKAKIAPANKGRRAPTEDK